MVDRENVATATELREMLAKRGLQASSPRLAVLQHVLGSGRHSTPDEIFERLGPQTGSLSRASVYNNLAALTAAGLLERLDTPGGTRYGRVTEPHVNLVCTECSEVTDVLVADSAVTELTRRATAAASFEPESVSLSVLGLCAKCAARPDARGPSSESLMAGDHDQR